MFIIWYCYKVRQIVYTMVICYRCIVTLVASVRVVWPFNKKRSPLSVSTVFVYAATRQRIVSNIIRIQRLPGGIFTNVVNTFGGMFFDDKLVPSCSDYVF